MYDPLRQQIDVMLERGFVRPKAVQALMWTATVDEALDAVEAGLAGSEPLRPEPAELLEAEP